MVKFVTRIALKLYRYASSVGNYAIRLEERIPKVVKMLGLVVLFVASASLTWWYLRDKNLTMLNPHGTIGLAQQKLIYVALLLSVLVVVPVFFISLFVYSKFHENNTSAKYQPGWDHNYKIETIWWTIPVIIIGILSVLTWKSSHELDPFKRISSDKETLVVEVIALDWKWLFLYPEQGVASINEVHIPVDTPVDFKITADAPMNSLWIPELGGQIYAMSGMTTHLNAMATSVGTYNGSSANMSGRGFAGMKFTVTAESEHSFDEWVTSVRANSNIFNKDTYQALAVPSEDTPAQSFLLQDTSLFDKVLLKYMHPTSTSQQPELGNVYGGGTSHE